MRRREFIAVLGGAAARGRSRRVRSRRARAAHRRADACSRGRSGGSGPHRGVPAGARSNWAGPTAATCASRHRWATANADRHSQTCGGIGRARAGRHPGEWQRGRGAAAARRRAPCRSCSRSSPIRSAPASSTAWRGRAATPPDLSLFEYGISGKWLELLKEIAPGVTRVAVLRDAGLSVGAGQFGAMQSVAPSFGVELRPIDVRDAPRSSARSRPSRAPPNGGLIVTAKRIGGDSSRN